MSWDLLYSSDYVLTRMIFQKSLAFVYLMGFLIAANQGRGLIGKNGLLPAELFIARTTWQQFPSLFRIKCSDQILSLTASLGLLLSLLALTGLSESFGHLFSMLVWFLMWTLYMSFINVGQEFYGFGWETLLLETGFLAIFLGPTGSPVPLLLVWLYRWLAFRLMFGAGLIKIRGDPCWRDYTCMYYHYETQPLPGPFSRSFHHAPKWLHRFSIFVNHLVELIFPFGLFGPGYLRWVAGAGTILFQLSIFIGGNYSWLNVISIVTCLFCFDDDFFRLFFDYPKYFLPEVPLWNAGLIGAVFVLIASLSYRPARNLFSKRQAMNRSFDRLHLCNTYGAFGSVTKERPEIILEGTLDKALTSQTRWVPYEFKGKPGDPSRKPRQVSPYHYKLDWQMWFASMSDYRYNPWILNLVAKLLTRQQEVMGLIQADPFDGQKPTYIRAELYLYQYTKPGEPGTWTRTRLASYLPPLSLESESFKSYLKEESWI